MNNCKNMDSNTAQNIFAMLTPVEDGSVYPSDGESNMQELTLLKKIMDEMPGGFFIYHAEGNEEIIYANKALLRIFGCSTIEEFRALTGNSFRGIVHPDDYERVEESIRIQIEDSQYDLDYVEYRIIRKDGEIRCG